MRILICGAGQVGFGIAERLSGEGNDVSIVDQDPSLVRRIGDLLDVSGFCRERRPTPMCSIRRARATPTCSSP